MARNHITNTQLSPWLFDGSATDQAPEFLAKIAEHDDALDALESGGGTAVILTPASLGAGTYHNYSPTGWDTTTITILQQAASGALIFTGLDSTGATNNTRIKLDNISLSSITLNHQNAGSTAANRFSLPDVFDIVIPRNASRYLRYDTATSRWRTDS